MTTRDVSGVCRQSDIASIIRNRVTNCYRAAVQNHRRSCLLPLRIPPAIPARLTLHRVSHSSWARPFHELTVSTLSRPRLTPCSFSLNSRGAKSDIWSQDLWPELKKDNSLGRTLSFAGSARGMERKLSHHVLPVANASRENCRKNRWS